MINFSSSNFDEILFKRLILKILSAENGTFYLYVGIVLLFTILHDEVCKILRLMFQVFILHAYKYQSLT